MKSILITGASGFVGGYLAEYLLQQGNASIYGTYLSEESLAKSPVRDAIIFRKLDLENREEVFTILQDIQPQEIYHLAALANVGESFKNPSRVFHANVDAEINVFEGMKNAHLTNAKILITSSAEVYGYVKPEDLPINESTPLRPANPYAVSKIAQDFLGLQYFLSYKLPIIRVRPFNHIGPRQQTGYVVADFAKQVAEIEKGKRRAVVSVGNLEAKRDFTDVRDMVKAYGFLMEKGEAGEIYNIGSGKSHKISEVLDMLISFARVPITKEIDKSKLRPSDVPEIIADTTKFTSLTGWKPEISFEKTIQETLDYWRQIV